MATPQQKKLIKLVLENMGKKKTKKTLGQLLLDAGYSKSISDNPYLIFGSATVQEGLEDVVDDLKKQRIKAIARMNATVNKAKYRDAVDALDKITKNIQLLSGGKTEDSHMTVSWEK